MGSLISFTCGGEKVRVANSHDSRSDLLYASRIVTASLGVRSARHSLASRLARLREIITTRSTAFSYGLGLVAIDSVATGCPNLLRRAQARTFGLVLVISSSSNACTTRL